jgi:predicted Zn-dependent protease
MRAIEKAERSRDPRAVEPGRWTVVMEPTAVANMVG